MTPQQNATAALERWQELRRAGLTPEQRLEELMRSVFAPSLEMDFRYQDQLNAVQHEMERA